MSSWYGFRSRCPGKGCTNPNEIYWRHVTCYNSQYIREDGFIRCKNSDCIKPTFIMEFSFRCENHSDFRKCSGERVLDAILVALKTTAINKYTRKKIIANIFKYNEDDDDDD